MTTISSTSSTRTNPFVFVQIFLVRLYIIATFRLGFRQSKWFTKKWYNLFSVLCGKVFAEFGCMNYGYSSPELDDSLAMEDEDAKERYQKQLYYHVVSSTGKTKAKGLKILEVGSGRGGGISYIARTFKPEEIVGLELSSSAVDYCAKKYKDIKSLCFMQGDAEHIPFPDNYFDIVINVESSHCYPNFDNFISEVIRVLKPEGFVSITDCRYHNKLEEFREGLRREELRVIKDIDITSNIIDSLEKDTLRKSTIIDKAAIPGFLKSSLINFGGCKGGTTYNEFNTRHRLYHTICCQKISN